MVNFVVLFFRFHLFDLNFTAATAPQTMATTPFAGSAAQPSPVQDYVKLFKAEKDNLEFAEGLYNWIGNDVENRVLKKYNKLPQ